MADPYGSHTAVLAALAKAVPVRSVLELGGGLHSTPLFLNRDVFPDLEWLVTMETDEEWARKIGTDDTRHTVLVADPSLVKCHGYDLVLVDDSDSMIARIRTIEAVSAFRPEGLVVVHDFENSEYREATKFDHVVVSERRVPWTAVAWNEGSRHGSGRLHRIVAEA